MGFLEGKEGFLWHFLQGWWYRTLVDAKVMEIKRACGYDRERIRKYLKEKCGVVLSDNNSGGGKWLGISDFLVATAAGRRAVA